jgi:hypothetical protein
MFLLRRWIMKSGRAIIVLAIMLFTSLAAVDQCNAEKFYLGATAGISRVRGDNADIWNDEYIIRANLCYEMSPRFVAGVSGGYSSWTPTNEELVGAIWDVREPARIFDVFTSLRAYLFTRDDLPVDLFLLGGLGIAFIHDAEVYIQPVVPDPPPPERREILGDATVAEVLFGAGLNFKITDQLLLELVPTYTILFHETGNEKTLEYYSISIGLLFRI